MSKSLEELIEIARQHPMTDEQARAQRDAWEEAEEDLSRREQSTTTVLPYGPH